MNSKIRLNLKWSLVIVLLFSIQLFANNKLKVVTSFSDYASITEFIAGEYADVEYISQGNQDPHFVPPKPGFAMMLQKADIWITTGMDLEGWSTTLLDKARNQHIMDGQTGFVAVSPGIPILQKVTGNIDQSRGDIHLMGNPHIHTGPLNWKHIAENITIGLVKNMPEKKDYFVSNLEKFIKKIDYSLFGKELVDMFGGERLSDMLLNHTLFDFLEREYQGEKLKNKLGGWLKKGLSFRGKQVIAYHKNWAYFADQFGLKVVEYIEPKPGIPPTPKHVQKITNLIKDMNIDLMLVASYFEKRKPQTIAQKTGIEALFLPLSVDAIPEVSDNFKLVDYWIEKINEAVQN